MMHSTDRLTGFTSASKRRIYKEIIIIEYINMGCPLYKIQLIPCSRFLLQKLTVLQLVQKYPTFYGIWRFIIVFKRAYHLSLSWARQIHSTSPQSHFFKISFNIFLSLTPIYLHGLSPSGLPTKLCMKASHLPYVPYTMLDVFDKMHINY